MRETAHSQLDAMFPPGYKVLTSPAGKMSLLTDFINGVRHTTPTH